MKLLALLLLTLTLVLPGPSRSAAPEGVTEVTLPILDYGILVHGGMVAGRHYAPLAFRVDGQGKLVALVAGTVANMQSEETPPLGQDLVRALQQGRTVGFSDAEVKKLGPRFLAAFEAGLAKVRDADPSKPTIVLIRNSEIRDPSTGETFSVVDQEWQKTLRQDFSKIDPLARLLVIRLVFPEQS